MIAEKGQTKELEIDYRDQNGNPLAPDTFEAVITEAATDIVVATITDHTVSESGSIIVDIPTSFLNVGRHFINIKATHQDYHQENVVMLDIHDHEGTVPQ